MKSIILSVIIVTYNASNSIEKTLCSLIELAKSEDVEIIVVDGLSNDDTLDKIRSCVPVDKCVSEPDDGIYNAMNKGANLAKGEWIYFLNAGDRLLVNVDKIINKLTSIDGDISVCCGDVEVKRNDGNSFIKKASIQDGSSFFFRMPVCHQSIFYRRCFFSPFDETYHVIADKVHLYNVFKLNVNSIFFLHYTVSEYELGGYSEVHRKIYHAEEVRFFMNIKNVPSIFYMPMVMYLNIKTKLLRLFYHIKSF